MYIPVNINIKNYDIYEYEYADENRCHFLFLKKLAWLCLLSLSETYIMQRQATW